MDGVEVIVAVKSWQKCLEAVVIMNRFIAVRRRCTCEQEEKYVGRIFVMAVSNMMPPAICLISMLETNARTKDTPPRKATNFLQGRQIRTSVFYTSMTFWGWRMQHWQFSLVFSLTLKTSVGLYGSNKSTDTQKVTVARFRTQHSRWLLCNGMLLQS